MAQIFRINNDSTLLNCLYELFPGQSRTGVKEYLKDGRVIVNRQNISAFDHPVKKGDTIEILSRCFHRTRYEARGQGYPRQKRSENHL